MSLLKEFEQSFEKLFEGFFTKRFKSAVKPIELAKQLVKEMEQKKTPGISGFYLPNQYRIFLNTQDFDDLAPILSALSKELKQLLFRRAQEEKSSFLGPPSVEINPDDLLDIGEIRIESKIEVVEDWEMPSLEKTQIFTPDTVAVCEPPPVFLISRKTGHSFVIDKDKITIGRKEDNDLVIKAPSVSRYHAVIEKRLDGLFLQDLGSTNGTFVNNKRIKRKKLRDGDLIVFAEEEFEFRSE